MTVSDFRPVFTVRDRQALRHALEDRRRRLLSAAQLYEQTKQISAARAALLRRTRDDVAAIEAALARIDRAGFGECVVCRRRLSVPMLTLQPLAEHCDDCGSSPSRDSLRPPRREPAIS